MGTYRLRKARLLRHVSRFSQSIWFIPTGLSLGALVLFVVTTSIDQRWAADLAQQRLPKWALLWLFAGDAASAQSLLTTIAGMWAAIIGISFSVTLVTLQLTATKYIAQVLPLFESNRINQWVLGSYLATVIYALLVLRTVRGAPSPFVPYVGVNVAMVFAVLALFLLILFISNVIRFVRPQHLLDLIAGDLRQCLKAGEPLTRLPGLQPLPQDPPPPGSGGIPLHAQREGLLSGIEWEALCLTLREYLERRSSESGVYRLYLRKALGSRVDIDADEPVAVLTVPEGSRDGEPLARLLRMAIVVESTRWQSQDADYSLEALAGITIKGAVQGDLEVAFEGVEHLFTVLEPLARNSAPSRVHLRGGRNEFQIVRPVKDLLGKLVRELTLISEVALAPSLPFRPLTEGISDRFVTVLGAFADEDDWQPFLATLEHLGPWYQSAFFHLKWSNGLERLAFDLADLTLRVNARQHLPALEAMTALLRELYARQEAGSAGQRALADAFESLRAKGLPASLLPAGSA